MRVENFESEHLQVGLCTEILESPIIHSCLLLHPFRTLVWLSKVFGILILAVYEMK